MHRAAQDAQPRGWGNATRLRREAAEAGRRARAAERDLALVIEQHSQAQSRIAELEREIEILHGRPRRLPVHASRHYWEIVRRTGPAGLVATLDRATDQMIGSLADPTSVAAGQGRARAGPGSSFRPVRARRPT